MAPANEAATAAGGVVVPAATLPKRLTGISPPAGRGTFEGGHQYPWWTYEFNGGDEVGGADQRMNSMAAMR